MCIFNRSAPEPEPMIDSATAPTVGRIPDQLLESKLPEKKEIVDPDETDVEVKYGATKKQSGVAAGQKTGTAALRIPLNTGAGAGGGGVSV